MAIKNTKKYIRSLVVIVLVGLNVGLYHSYAQEPTEPPTDPAPTTTTTGDNPNPVPDQTPSSTDDGGFLGGIIDFVEEVIDGEDETPPVIETPVEPEIIPPAPIVTESIPNVVVNKPLIPFRGKVSKKKSDIDYTNGSYICAVSPFVNNVSSGTANAVVKIKNLNQIGSQSRQVMIGELPNGFKITFANDNFSQDAAGSQTEFPISIIKSSYAQKGSFIVPIFYSVGATTVMCQMNVVNNG